MADTAYREVFPQEDVAVVVVDGETPAGAQAAARDLAGRLQQRAGLIEWVELPILSPYFERYGLMFLEPDQIRAIGEQIRPARRLMIDSRQGPEPARDGAAPRSRRRGCCGKRGAAVARASSLADRRFGPRRAPPASRRRCKWSELFSVGAGLGGTRQVIQLKPVLNNRSINRAGPALDAMHAAIDETRAAYPDASFRVTGEPVLRQQELNDAFSSALYASGLSLILVAAILTIGIRSGRTIAALLIALLVGAVWTAGLASISVGRLNLISVAFMVLFFGLGIDFGTHLSLRYLEAARRGMSFDRSLKTRGGGRGAEHQPERLVRGARLPLLRADALCRSRRVRHHLGASACWSRWSSPSRCCRRFFRSCGRSRRRAPCSTIGIGLLVNRHYRAILVIAGIATVAAAFMATRAEIDTNPLNLQNQNTEAVQTYRELAANPETSPYALNVVAPTSEAARRARATRLSALPGVAGVRWIENFVPRDQEPKLAALAAVRERLGESFFAAEPPRRRRRDAELEEAFAKIKASADAIAATPADNPIDPSIPAAGPRARRGALRISRTRVARARER